MYQIVSKYYDMMYVNDESYKSEIDKVISLVDQYKKSNSNELLDIACGTGAQAAYLQNNFVVTGIDISDDMLDIAKMKVTKATFQNADMCDFDLEKQFDVIVNLYGSIGHAESIERLQMAMTCAFKHLKQGGVYILTPWSTKESFKEALVCKSKTIDLTGFCRMETVKRISDNQIEVDYHHLISDNLDVKYYKHTGFVSLFSESEYEECIFKAGLRILKRLQPDEFRMGAFICTV
jgi:ubiquinone/menaquinone biosynthesis C-methylase UbiE